MARAPGPNLQVAQLSLKRERGACFVLLWIYKSASLAELASFCQLVLSIFTVHDVIEKKSPMASQANVLCHGKVLNVIARWLYIYLALTYLKTRSKFNKYL
jgi:hypothetical protein